jgi:transposase
LKFAGNQDFKTMANNLISMSKLRHILKMYCDGHSRRHIAKLHSTSRNTVRRHIKQFQCLKISYEELSRLSDKELDELFRNDNPVIPLSKVEQLYKFFQYAEKQLKRRGMTLQKLWEEYIQNYPDGYRPTSFYHYYNLWKKRSHPSMHINHKAGDKMFVDFAGEKLCIIDSSTGEIKEVEVFIAILGASQLTYIEAVESQKKDDFISACENALHYYGGSPLAIVPDNLKSAVIKSDRYEPKLNENFELFAHHYNMAVLPARVYKPKDKSLVEGAVKIAYNRIYTRLQSRTFFSLEELNASIRELLEEHNLLLLQGRNYSRRQQFEEMEKNTLQPLPENRFEMRQQTTVTVMKNGHVCLSCDKHYYSVPYQYLGKKVKVLYSKSMVEVYHRYELIASHKRIKSPHNYTTLSEHLATQHKYITEWNPERFLNEAAALDPAIEQYIQQVLIRKPHPEQAYKSCQGILSFAKRVGTERLKKACNRAADYGLYHYKIIESILQKGLDRYEKEQETESPMPQHENIRGKEYYI